MKENLRPVEVKIYEKSSHIYKKGYFHKFLQEGAGDGDSFEYCPVAIVELENGEVKSVYAENIRFLDDPKEE